jgi:hypothetical protein
MTLYRHFNLLMDRSPGFGSTATDYFALFRLAFAAAPYLLVLNLANNRNSSDRSTKSTPSDINVLRLLVSTGFQVLFHSPPGVLFTFPSQYCFTIGHRGVVRLGGWSPRLPTRFPVSRGTLVLTGSLSSRVRDCYALWTWLSIHSFHFNTREPSCQSATP